MADNIVLLADLKNELDIETTETSFDDRLQDLIDDVVVEAEEEIGAKLGEITDEIAYLDGGCQRVFLPHLNVTDVEVIEDTTRAFTGDPIDDDYYTLDVERGKVTMDGTLKFLSGRQVLKITYSAGYTSTTLPKDLKRAIIMQTAYRWRRRKDPGLSSVTYPDGTINKYSQDQWLPAVKRILDRYRRFFL